MVAAITPPDVVEVVSLEEFLSHPRDRTEWVDGKLIEKIRMTYKHGLAQGKLLTNHLDSAKCRCFLSHRSNNFSINYGR